MISYDENNRHSKNRKNNDTNQEHGTYLTSTNHDNDTDTHLQDMKSGANTILVAVRTRPLNSKEMNISNFETLKILDGKLVVLLDPMNEFDPNDPFRNNRNKERQYAFDFAFDKHDTTHDVYDRTTRILLDGIQSGYNATVFAYGATGAGKTFTMLGSGDQQGIMSLTLNDLFSEVESRKQDKDFAVKVSYVEVYNEMIKDLLSTEDNNLDLREDPVKGVCVAGVTEIGTNNTSEVMALLKVGNKNRTMEPTGANVVSSRSHAVLQISVEHKQKNQGINEEITIGKLSMIDLAGSERASNTNNKGMRMIEGANINRSLLALGNCITMLSEQAEKEKGGKAVHVPYRDSKLTRLLKDSLGGNCRTVMIANISPAVISFEDTHNTLKYANRAKNIKTNSVRNILQVSNHVAKYTQIISDLKSENENLKKHLQNQGPGGVSSGPMGGLQINEKLFNEIQAHFDQEIKLKKMIFDNEERMAIIQIEIALAVQELKSKDDEISRAKLQHNRDIQMKLHNNLEHHIPDYNIFVNKRQGLINTIKTEKSKENQNYLLSLVKQWQLHIENLELQHKEKLASNQLNAKEKEIQYLQNQIYLRDELINDPTSHNKAIHSIKDIVEHRKKGGLALDRLKQREKQSSPSRFASPKEYTRLPKLKVRESTDLNNIYGRRQPKQGDSSFDDSQLKLLKKVNNVQPQYYFRKHEWRKSVAQDAVLPKMKRNKYGQPINNRDISRSRSVKRQNSFNGINNKINKNAKAVRSINMTPRKASVTLSERSFVSTETTTSSDKHHFKNRMNSGKHGVENRNSIRRLPPGKFLPQLKNRYNHNQVLNKNNVYGNRKQLARYNSVRSHPTKEEESQNSSFNGGAIKSAKYIDNTYVQSKLSNLKSKAKLKAKEYDGSPLVLLNTAPDT
jgi:kinesin family protein 18/19